MVEIDSCCGRGLLRGLPGKLGNWQTTWRKITGSGGVLLPFCCHWYEKIKKPLGEKWLNYMNLKLKFGGPYWT
ncbi:hypothetical protein SPRA44_670021 [Serratia proteamaculans]|nr:hypothetical protein SPRA44_670021 [Serratia proteamaculans]